MAMPISELLRRNSVAEQQITISALSTLTPPSLSGGLQHLDYIREFIEGLSLPFTYHDIFLMPDIRLIHFAAMIEAWANEPSLLEKNNRLAVIVECVQNGVEQQGATERRTREECMENILEFLEARVTAITYTVDQLYSLTDAQIHLLDNQITCLMDETETETLPILTGQLVQTLAQFLPQQVVVPLGSGVVSSHPDDMDVVSDFFEVEGLGVGQEASDREEIQRFLTENQAIFVLGAYPLDLDRMTEEDRSDLANEIRAMEAENNAEHRAIIEGRVNLLLIEALDNQRTALGGIRDFRKRIALAYKVRFPTFIWAFKKLGRMFHWFTHEAKVEREIARMHKAEVNGYKHMAEKLLKGMTEDEADSYNDAYSDHSPFDRGCQIAVTDFAGIRRDITRKAMHQMLSANARDADNAKAAPELKTTTSTVVAPKAIPPKPARRRIRIR